MKKRKRIQRDFAIMDSDFMLSSQKTFHTKDGKQSAVAIDSVKNGSKKSLGILKRERIESQTNKVVQKSMTIEQDNEYTKIFSELKVMGYNKDFEYFKNIHVCKSSKRILVKKLKQTKDFLLKVAR